MPAAKTLLPLHRQLSDDLDSIRFGAPVEHVYNPLHYARAGAEAYLRLAGAHRRQGLLIGMNPGPWGMGQTGVPFGAVPWVTGWLGIAPVAVEEPPRLHPKRPIMGFDCERKEVSGDRFWGWAKEDFHTPRRFFERFFVANYCPLLFYDEAGRNVTPDKLRAEDRRQLFTLCDAALRRMAEVLAVEVAIGIGAFAEARAAEALEGLDLRVGRILHPSPASPAANRGWAPAARQQLRELGVRYSASG